jgi:hypothetical protein
MNDCYTRRIALTILVLAACQVKKEVPPTGQSDTGKDPTSHAAQRSDSVGTLHDCGEKIVRDEGVGRVRIGDSIDSVRAHCFVTRDTTALGAEGMPARKVVVRFADDSVVAEIVNDRVWRIELTSSAFATTDSLRVGTPISRMLRLRNPRGLAGEGQLFLVTSDHCGLSFRLSDPDGSAVRDWSRPVLSKLPPGTRVSEILIVGCANAGPASSAR